MASLTGKPPFDRQPLLIAVAGPNGAGKTTFCRYHLADLRLRYVNADLLARELALGPYEAAELTTTLRESLVRERESFVFETVFSDPAGDKLTFLVDAVAQGYTVVLCFVGLADAALSETRVAMRVLKGGHDVPTRKIRERFPRTLANLRRAIRALPHVLLFDNSDLSRPFRAVATFRDGALVEAGTPVPAWARRLVRPT
ncbi:MAG: zeta toxin family protein [Anaeromyxobacteraceae bacterium]